jgi:hypothetical protein
LLELTGLGLALAAFSSLAGVTTPANTAIGDSAPVSFGPEPVGPAPYEAPSAEPEPAADGLEQKVERNLGFGLLHVPEGFLPDACDLVIHFHGAPSTLIPEFDSAKLKAALLLVNVGVQSGPYERQFSDSASLERTLQATQKGLDGALGEQSCTIERVALSAWSAGYGAVARILSRERNVERVDAVLLADGLHAAYSDKRTRSVDPVGMRPFSRFGRLAADGHKLMSVTHSSIVPPGYASTTETAAFLIGELALGVSELGGEGPGEMEMTYRADVRGLHFKGFRGWDAVAHGQHLHNMGETLFPELRERWGTR